MSLNGQERRWICGSAGAVNLHHVSSIVREIREPCLHHSLGKGSKMLRSEKWQSVFDSDGKIVAFQKALKLIVLGGVDPSVRAEVWEFLLGCYALGSTSEYRKQLRMARRLRFKDLIRECQMMHSSIGTGRLAYDVGSKVMGSRTPSKDHHIPEKEEKGKKGYCGTFNNIETCYDLNNHCTDASYAQEKESSSDSVDLVSFKGSTDCAACDSSYVVNSSSAYHCFCTKPEIELH